MCFVCEYSTSQNFENACGQRGTHRHPPFEATRLTSYQTYSV